MRKSYICCPKRLKSNNGTEIRGKIRAVHGGIHGGRTDGRFWYFLQNRRCFSLHQWQCLCGCDGLYHRGNQCGFFCGVYGQLRHFLSERRRHPALCGISLWEKNCGLCGLGLFHYVFAFAGRSPTHGIRYLHFSFPCRVYPF